ncbi:MAG: hypothetical protein AMXMBFR12_09000 [Candidatus Babeliales bacterium]
MKKLLSLVLSLSCALHGNDALFLAIKKSDPILVKSEIKKLASMDQKPSIKDKRMYIDFAEEVIIRRRNAIQFPIYECTPVYCNGMLSYYNKPVYKNAYTTDVDPEISFNCGVRLTLGAFGTVASLFYWLNSYTTSTGLVITTGVISFFTLLSAIVEIEINRKQHQEQLYENAIEIKHILMNFEVT